MIQYVETRKRDASPAPPMLLCIRHHDLVDGMVEDGIGEGLLNLLFEPEVRSHVGDVSIGRATTAAGKQADDPAQPINND